MKNLSIIFEAKPTTWGYRGDEPLWDALKSYFETIDVPETPEDFRQTFLDLFRELTGKELEPFKTFYVKEFDKGGMSGGSVYGYLWYCRLLPELTERYLAYKYNPESIRIYRNISNYRIKTDEEKRMEDELIQKSNAMHHFIMGGLEEVKKLFPKWVDFVESVKHRNPKEVIFELNAQQASLS